MKLKAISLIATVVFSLCAAPLASRAADNTQARIKPAVDAAIQPVMAKYHIAGMAIGVIAEGKPYVFNYGVASRASGKPVTRDTLFEVGSVSKTLTATLASYAQVNGNLSLSDTSGKYMPALEDTSFGNVSLLNLGTHTPGVFQRVETHLCARHLPDLREPGHWYARPDHRKKHGTGLHRVDGAAPVSRVGNEEQLHRRAPSENAGLRARL